MEAVTPEMENDVMKKRKDYGPADVYAEAQMISGLIALVVIAIMVAWHFVAKIFA